MTLLAFGWVPRTPAATVVSHWTLDENAGITAADSGPSHNTGALTTVGPGAAGWTNGIAGSAVNLVGGSTEPNPNNGGFVTAGNPASLDFESNNAFSISAWMKVPAGVTQDSTIVGKMHQWTTADPHYPGYEIHYSGGNPSLSTGQLVVWLINDFVDAPVPHCIYLYCGVPINDGNWHQVAFAYDGSGLANGVSMYVDGLRVSPTIQSDTLGSNSIRTGANFNIGSRNDGAFHNFTGAIDDVQVYNGGLTPAEMLFLFQHPGSVIKSTATVTLGSLNPTYDGTPKAATTTTTPPGLNVTFTYNGSATVPIAVGSYTVVGTVNDANYQGSATGTLVISKGTAPVTLGSLAATYDGSAKAATATTVPPGLSVTFTYNGSATVPIAVGSYTVVGTVNDANYQGSATGTLVISKGTATVTLGSLAPTYDGTSKAATATTAPPGLNVTFTYNGSATVPIAAGSYTVVGTVNEANYQGSATGTLVISKGTATVTLGSLATTYDGSAKAATATTVPPGLSVTYTYNGSATVPIAAGSYTVVGTVNDANYQGSVTGTLVISKGTATVTLGSLAATYDGSAKAATATTAPPGLNVTFTYNGSATVPIAAGSYTVVGTVNDANYQGSATGTLTIAGGQLTLVSIAVTPSNPTVAIGSNQPFTATGTFSDGSVRPLTNGSQNWAAKASFPEGQYSLAAGVVNGVLYVVGGLLPDVSAALYAYDPRTDTWSTRAPMPTARYYPGAGVVGGILYVVGGDNHGNLATVEAYDPTTNTWTTKTPMPTARYNMGVAVVNGILYAIGGAASLQIGTEDFATVEAYDPSTDSWTTKTPMPITNKDFAIGVISNTIYVAGGARLGIGAVPNVYAYNPAGDAWTAKSSMPTARFGLRAGVVNSIFYAMGGSFPDVASVSAYDPTTDRWTPQVSLMTARDDFAAGEIQGVLYAVAGDNNGGPLSSVEAFTPPEVAWTSGNPTVASITSGGLETALSAGTSTITATDGGIAGSTLLTVLSAADSWRLQKFGDSTNTGNAADTADPNGNGIPNLVEYALNGDPTGNSTGASILPQASSNGTNVLQLSFNRYLDRNDVTLIAQGADSPAGPWTDLASSTAGGAFTVLATGATVSETGSGNTRAVIVGDIYSMTDPSHPRRFMRLKVTRP